jgi:hypothetical protein
VKYTVFERLRIEECNPAELVLCFECLSNARLPKEALQLFDKIKHNPKQSNDIVIAAMLKCLSSTAQSAQTGLQLYYKLAETVSIVGSSAHTALSALHLLSTAYPGNISRILTEMLDIIGLLRKRAACVHASIYVSAMGLAERLRADETLLALYAEAKQYDVTSLAIDNIMLVHYRRKLLYEQCYALYAERLRLESLDTSVDVIKALDSSFLQEMLLVCTLNENWGLGVQLLTGLLDKTTAAQQQQQQQQQRWDERTCVTSLRFITALRKHLTRHPTSSNPLELLPSTSDALHHADATVRGTHALQKSLRKALAMEQPILQHVLRRLGHTDMRPNPAVFFPLATSIAEIGGGFVLIQYLRSQQAIFRSPTFNASSFVLAFATAWAKSGYWRDCLMLVELVYCSPELMKTHDKIKLYGSTFVALLQVKQFKRAEQFLQHQVMTLLNAGGEKKRKKLLEDFLSAFQVLRRSELLIKAEDMLRVQGVELVANNNNI